MTIPYLRNANMFAIHCKDEGDRIAVGILAIKSDAVFGTVQTLYSEQAEPYHVEIPQIPQEYNEVLSRVRTTV